ncbi:MAG TPA: alanyl-tRNA editing protein, partial [Acidimicrobiales bacterium]|nr:alanyl-tRNA editing protein [Acidimicrobiales bacterium]
MPAALYLHDAYLREFDSKVEDVGPTGVTLQETAFYPAGGGQPFDTGILRDATDHRWRVAGVDKTPQGIRHRLEGDGAPAAGDSIHGEVDWGRRYSNMRYHTALH